MAAWVRFSACSLPKMFETWVFTVLSVITSFSAISSMPVSRADQSHADGENGGLGSVGDAQL
jgi:hypothetical protein